MACRSLLKAYIPAIAALITLPSFAQNVRVDIDLSKPGKPLEVSRFALGQGGLSDDSIWGNRIPEVRALRPRLVRLFIQEYFDLLPDLDQYRWSKLDAAVDTILGTGATPLMNIDMKPHVLYPSVDETITDPNDYPAWERFIGAMVTHYKERGSRIGYWEVANEPDIGERGGCPYKFTPEGYARYYAHTAAAIRKADPGAKVGGPALANADSDLLPELLRVADRDKLPLDFVSWHIYSDSPAAIRETIEKKKRQIAPFSTLHPELILDEWNMSLKNGQVDPRFQPAFIAETAWQMFEGGLDYACYYHIRDYHVRVEQFLAFMSPKGAREMAWWWNRKPQYDGLFDYQDHVRPAYFTFLLLSRLTGQRVNVESSAEQVHGLATWDPDLKRYSILMWNFSGQAADVHVRVKGSEGTLNVAPERQDPQARSTDENLQLKPLPEFQLKSGAEYALTLEPYDIYFWELTPTQR